MSLQAHDVRRNQLLSRRHQGSRSRRPMWAPSQWGGVRVAPEQVRLDAGRLKGWIPDRNMTYSLVDASRDGWVITIAYGNLPHA